MKLPIRFASLGVLASLSFPLLAAPATSSKPNDPVVETQPAAEATPALSATPSEVSRSEPRAVAEAVQNFFTQLQAGQVDTAYDQLLKGTKIADSPSDVTMLKNKTREAIKAFGAIGGYDFVKVERVGRHLQCATCLSLGKDFPLRWRFYFYEAGEIWRLIDIRISDRLVDMFDEPVAVPSNPASAKQ